MDEAPPANDPLRLKLADWAMDRIVCPRHKTQRLVLRDGTLACGLPDCGARYPIVDGRPILIDEARSVFSIADFVGRRTTTFDPETSEAPSLTPGQRLKAALSNLTPSATYEAKEMQPADALNHVAARIARPRVLVLGAGDAAMEVAGAFDIVYSDVAMRRLTDLIADAHDIPFADRTFDLVLACAVLEHVADPQRCVGEIVRVLRPGGYVFAATPFMQQVHMGAYDFTRFTFVGHRRLFRRFEEIRAGVVNGPATALAWTFEHYLAAFSERAGTRSALRTLARFMTFPILWTDRILARKAGAYTAASAYYFFGQLSERELSDREILEFYKPPVP